MDRPAAERLAITLRIAGMLAGWETLPSCHGSGRVSIQFLPLPAWSPEGAWVKLPRHN